jgi:hypothetical protein
MATEARELLSYSEVVRIFIFPRIDGFSSAATYPNRLSLRAPDRIYLNRPRAQPF